MANLSRDQAIELIKQPKNAREIQKARKKRIRHKLHTDPEVDTENIYVSGQEHVLFLLWVERVLKSPDNFDRFKQLYRPPLVTNELTESIFSEFEKVFGAKNSFEKIEFVDNELERDFNDYRKRIGDFNFWETQGFETFKNSIDNILIIDLPNIEPDDDGVIRPKSDRPEPYYYLLDINDLIDICNERVDGDDNAGNVQFYYFRTEYIIFRGDGGLVYVFDDTYFRSYKLNDSTDPVMINEIPHNLGFTPARSFWTTPLNSSSKIQKRGPITNSLSELDRYLFNSIGQQYLELYAPYPVYAMYRSKCNYVETSTRKAKCVDGILQWTGQQIGGPNYLPEYCPHCSSKMKVGPGNIMLIDVPREKSDDFDLMQNPMKVIPAEETSLKYVKEMMLDKRNEIFSNCVGRGTDAQNDQAVNELQITSSFESRTSVLLKIKRNFEIIHEFALDTLARLRYGDKYLSARIDYGDEFFAQDEGTEIKEYETAVKNGLPSYDLATRRQAINDARYRNNPDQLERLRIMRNLEPFPDNNTLQVQDIRTKSPELISLRDMILKINFNSLIDRFEREQANILLFGSAIAFDKKINAIQSELYRYADEIILANAPTPAPPVVDPVPVIA